MYGWTYTGREQIKHKAVFLRGQQRPALSCDYLGFCVCVFVCLSRCLFVTCILYAWQQLGWQQLQQLFLKRDWSRTCRIIMQRCLIANKILSGSCLKKSAEKSHDIEQISQTLPEIHRTTACCVRSGTSSFFSYSETLTCEVCAVIVCKDHHSWTINGKIRLMISSIHRQEPGGVWQNICMSGIKAHITVKPQGVNHQNEWT